MEGEDLQKAVGVTAGVAGVDVQRMLRQSGGMSLFINAFVN